MKADWVSGRGFAAVQAACARFRLVRRWAARGHAARPPKPCSARCSSCYTRAGALTRCTMQARGQVCWAPAWRRQCTARPARRRQLPKTADRASSHAARRAAVAFTFRTPPAEPSTCSIVAHRIHTHIHRSTASVQQQQAQAAMAMFGGGFDTFAGAGFAPSQTQAAGDGGYGKVRAQGAAAARGRPAATAARVICRPAGPDACSGVRGDGKCLFCP